MKRVLFIFALMLCALPALAQTQIQSFAADPVTCDPTRGLMYYNTVSQFFKICTAVNTWSNLGGGGGGSPGGVPFQIQYNNSGAFGGIAGSAVTPATGALSLTAGADTTTPFTVVAHSATQSGTLTEGNSNVVGGPLGFPFEWRGSGPNSPSWSASGGHALAYIGTKDDTSIGLMVTNESHAGSNGVHPAIGIYTDANGIPTVSGGNATGDGSGNYTALQFHANRSVLGESSAPGSLAVFISAAGNGTVPLTLFQPIGGAGPGANDSFDIFRGTALGFPLVGFDSGGAPGSPASNINLFFNGSTSGTAKLGVAAAAGTPCTFLLPTTSPTVGQILSSAAPSGGNCQTSWSSVGVGAPVSIPAYPAIPTSDLFIGTTAGAAGNNTTTGIDSVGVGENALSAMTTSTSPAANTALGFGACASVTTAREMTCLGFNAGTAFTGNGTGSNDGISTFIGSQAGQAMVGTGAGQTDFLCLGQKSCTNLTAGGASIFIGNHSGSGVTTGTNSVIIGNTTMDSTVGATATDTVVIGYNAVHGGTGAFTKNVFIGKDVADVATAADQDVVVGFQAGIAMTSGANSSVFVGAGAGRSITNSSGSVFIGTNAGQSATAGQDVAIGVSACSAMTGSGNATDTCIGANTALSGVSDTNETVIGAAVTGAGSNTVVIGNASVTDAYVGSSAPTAAFHAKAYDTATNCSSSASPAVCASAAAGSVVIAAAATTITVNTTAVTANSQIFLAADDTLGTKLGVTCNSTLATLVGGLAVTARTAGTSFQITSGATPAVNPLCISYFIVN